MSKDTSDCLGDCDGGSSDALRKGVCLREGTLKSCMSTISGLFGSRDEFPELARDDGGARRMG